MNSESKKIGIIKKILPILIFLFIGFICGLLMLRYLASLKESGKSVFEILIYLAVLIFGMYIAVFLHVIIHEGGHLITGLMSGYRFSSFRVGSLMWLKKDGKIRFTRLSLAGTGGQCLMAPCDMKDGRIPYVFYNLGGTLMNLLSAMIFFLLAYLVPNGIFSVLLMMLAVIGVVFALYNGIPIKLEYANNDGYNIISIGKDKEAMRAFWLQLKVNELLASGIRLKEMPEEWFKLPDQSYLNNSIVAAIAVLDCNRLIDQLRIEEAKEAIEGLLDMDTAIMGLYRNLLINDLIYCELVTANDRGKIEKLLDKQQKKFMKLMKSYPSVMRTEYVYALLGEKEDSKARQLRDSFDKKVKSYPYPVEIQMEYELIDYAYSRYLEAEKPMHSGAYSF